VTACGKKKKSFGKPTKRRRKGFGKKTNRGLKNGGNFGGKKKKGEGLLRCHALKLGKDHEGKPGRSRTGSPLRRSFAGGNEKENSRGTTGVSLKKVVREALGTGESAPAYMPPSKGREVEKGNDFTALPYSTPKVFEGHEGRVRGKGKTMQEIFQPPALDLKRKFRQNQKGGHR